MRRAEINKAGALVLMFFLVIGALIGYNQYRSTKKINKAFAVGYKLFDVIYYRKYFDTQAGCWRDNKKILDDFYLKDGHYITGQYKYLQSGGTQKHAHFKELWRRCDDTTRN